MNSIFHESKEYRTYILYLPTLTFNVSSNKNQIIILVGAK